MHVLCVSEGEGNRRDGMKLSECIGVHYRMEIRNLDLVLNLHLYLSSLFTTVESMQDLHLIANTAVKR